MVFRVKKNKNYTVMSNYHLRDKNISLKAKGLLSWMLSNNDDWDYTISGIVACCKEGETTITTALRELQDTGYVVVKKINPNKECNKIHYEYYVFEEPQQGDNQDIDFQGVESQGVENQGLESQGVENQGQRNTNKNNTNLSNTKKSNTETNNINPLPPKRNGDVMKQMVDNTELSDNLKNTIKEWLDYKKEIKKPYKSERGFQQFINIVAKYSLTYSDDEIINVINKSMASGYQGVVWDWLEKGKKTNSYVDAINNRMNVVDDWLNEMQNGGE